ncbi:MAG TPA: hypothetical protein VMM83_03300 [Longimicrobiales bacterium]|nr:hypothetical protein [Longimicrobiales bacterium]
MIEDGNRVARIRTAAREGIEEATRYVWERELEGMRSDLATQVRRHPLGAIAVAFLAGYIVRRIS